MGGLCCSDGKALYADLPSELVVPKQKALPCEWYRLKILVRKFVFTQVVEKTAQSECRFSLLCFFPSRTEVSLVDTQVFLVGEVFFSLV